MKLASLTIKTPWLNCFSTDKVSSNTMAYLDLYGDVMIPNAQWIKQFKGVSGPLLIQFCDPKHSILNEREH